MDETNFIRPFSASHAGRWVQRMSRERVGNLRRVFPANVFPDGWPASWQAGAKEAGTKDSDASASAATAPRRPDGPG